MKEVWVYDLRTNMPSFGKRTPPTVAHFDAFVAAYTSEERTKVEDDRWNVFTREEIRKKDDSLDIGLITDESLSAYDNLPDPIDSAEETIAKLEEALALLGEVVAELKAVETKQSDYVKSKPKLSLVAEVSGVYGNDKD